MQNQREDLSDRLLEFGANTILLCEKLNRSPAQRHIAGQLVRSSTSSGANYEEACAAESRADFIHKMQIVLKELRESFYWLRLLTKTRLVSAERLLTELREAEELIKIFTKSIVTAKSNRK
ncbi:MAG: four helix bundle protein [Deltaproteobacteria bacterium]|nr:four helix bundle protein [Deltaproteobacteria bacterium]